MSDDKGTNTGGDEKDPFVNPLSRRTPFGGRWGVMVVSLTPFVALILFFVFGWAIGGWAWAWIFFLLVPIVSIVVYGAGGRDGRR